MYTTQTPTTADRMARVMAAGRITDARRTAERKAADRRGMTIRYADRVIATLRSEGAVKVGMKVCHEDGWKERSVFMIEDPACHERIATTAGMEAEVWGITAEGEHTTSVF